MKTKKPTQKKIQKIVWQPDNVTYAIGGLSGTQYDILGTVMYNLKYELVDRDEIGSWESLVRKLKESPIERTEWGNPVVRTTLEELGINRHNRAFAEKQLDQLVKLTFIFPFAVFDDGSLDKDGFTVAGLLSKGTVSSGGEVRLVLNNEILPFLLIYGGKIGNGITKYIQNIMKNLSGKYSKNLYMLLCSLVERKYPHKMFPVGELRTILGIPPQRDNRYLKQVLNKCRSELLEKADVWPEITYLSTPSGKNGRPEMTGVSLYARRSGTRAGEISPEKDELPEDSAYSSTFNAVQMLQEFGYLVKDSGVALHYTEQINAEGKCRLVAEKMRYYEQMKGQGKKARRERARLMARIIAEETSVPVLI